MINELLQWPQQLGFQNWLTFGLTVTVGVGALALVLRKLDQRSKGEMRMVIDDFRPALGTVLRGRLIIEPKRSLQIDSLTLDFNGYEVYGAQGQKSDTKYTLVYTDEITLRQNFSLNPPQRFDLPFEVNFPSCYKPTPSLADLNLDAIVGQGLLGRLLQSATKLQAQQMRQTQWTLQAEAVMSGANFLQSKTWKILVDPETLKRDWDDYVKSDPEAQRESLKSLRIHS